MTERAARCYALVPCAGIGARAGTAGPKQYAQVAGQTVLWHTLRALAGVRRLRGVLVVVAEGDLGAEREAFAMSSQCPVGAESSQCPVGAESGEHDAGEVSGQRGAASVGSAHEPSAASRGRETVAVNGERHAGAVSSDRGDVVAVSSDRGVVKANSVLSPVWIADCGGATRAASVRNGLEALRDHGAHASDWVLVHDAARCLVRSAWIDALIDACADDPVGGLLAAPLADTLKRADADQRAAATVPRGGLWQAQTPQMFRLGALREALAAAAPDVTDDASAIEAAGGAPKLVACSAENFKLTHPADFALAEVLLRARADDDKA